TATATPTAPSGNASVTFDDQFSNGSSVTVSSVELSDGGFVAIHNQSGAVVGVTDYLSAGSHSNVTASLSGPVEMNSTERLIAMPHYDSNDNQQWDFVSSNGSDDPPYLSQGMPVTDRALVTFSESGASNSSIGAANSEVAP
ncbi:MAG: hypothetical protein ABEJ28_11575, partial [Salinigranum sp.]